MHIATYNDYEKINFLIVKVNNAAAKSKDVSVIVGIRVDPCNL